MTFKALTAECFSFREQLDRNYYIVEELLPSWAQHLYAKENLSFTSRQIASHSSVVWSFVSHLGIRSHVLTLWANNFSVLGLLGAESLVSVAESQDVWGKT